MAESAPAADPKSPNAETEGAPKKARSLSFIRDLGAKVRNAAAAGAATARQGADGEGSQKGMRAAFAVREASACLSAPDRASRRMARMFWISWLGALALAAYASTRLVARHRDEKAKLQAQQMADFFEKQQQAARLKQSLLNVGVFHIELKPVPGRTNARGTVNMAQVELVAECDSRATCEFLEERIAEAKSQMTNVLLAIDRDELLSKRGKLLLKQSLIDALNRWLPHGSIKNIYFSRLIIT